jgi:hypothetical protein
MRAMHAAVRAFPLRPWEARSNPPAMASDSAKEMILLAVVELNVKSAVLRIKADSLLEEHRRLLARALRGGLTACLS